MSENCHKSPDEAPRRNVRITGCVNATYLGYRLERNALLVFEFRASNETNCVNETIAVVGRLWGVQAVVKTENGTVECPLQPVGGNYLENEVFHLGDCP